MPCTRWLLDADGHAASRCGADLHPEGSLLICAVGHQQGYTNIRPLPPHPTLHTTRLKETKR